MKTMEVKDLLDFGELADLAEPIVKWIRMNGDPHMEVLISEEAVRVVRDECFIPRMN